MDANQTKIRMATIEDFRIITELSRELGYESNEEHIQKRLEILLQSKQDAIYVATLTNSTVFGWIHVFITHRIESGSFGEIGGLVVSNQHRGQGIGKKLIIVAQSWLNQNGIEKIRVRSNMKRKNSHKFYSKLGFMIEKEQAVFDKPLK